VSAGVSSTAGAGVSTAVVSAASEVSAGLEQEAATVTTKAANKNLSDFFIRFWFKISFHTKKYPG
jgi:hypothetical protein